MEIFVFVSVPDVDVFVAAVVVGGVGVVVVVVVVVVSFTLSFSRELFKNNTKVQIAMHTSKITEKYSAMFLYAHDVRPIEISVVL